MTLRAAALTLPCRATASMRGACARSASRFPGQRWRSHAAIGAALGYTGGDGAVQWVLTGAAGATPVTWVLTPVSSPLETGKLTTLATKGSAIVKAGGAEIVDVDKASFQAAMKPVYDKFLKDPKLQDMVKRINAVK